MPEAFYRSRTIVGATNVPSVLDVRSFLSGTIIVDDSGPHCFDVPTAIERLESDGDILFTRAGQLSAPEPTIEGCMLSALLAATQTTTEATVGETTAAECQRQLQLLETLGYAAGPLEFVGYRVSDAQVTRFLARYGPEQGAPKR